MGRIFLKILSKSNNGEGLFLGPLIKREGTFPKSSYLTGRTFPKSSQKSLFSFISLEDSRL